MMTLILSHSDFSGGAARAAYRLHRALLTANIESYLQVGIKLSDDWRVLGPSGKLQKIIYQFGPTIDRLTAKLQQTTNPILHSAAWLGGLRANKINNSMADVINLHWICGGFMSVEEIGRITKPIVWTLHDSWAFCGAEHHPPGVETARWRQGYTKSNRDPRHSGLDIDRWVWLRKQKAWKRPFCIITPSNWLAGCARDSALLHDWPITVVPNPLDTEIYRPLDKSIARKILRLPPDVKLVLFGAVGGTKMPTKGWDLLQVALARMASRVPNVHGVIFGQSEPKHVPALGLPLHWMGHLHDDATLALLYSAVDVMVVPSRQENLPQSGTEAQACGCPVAAFNASGLPDVVVHGGTGYLAKAYSTDDLAKGIEWIIADDERHSLLSAKARERAVSLWSLGVVLPQYLEVYRRAIEQHQLKLA